MIGAHGYLGVGTATEYTLYDTITIFGPQYGIIAILSISRFCDTLRFISPIYYVSYTGSLCSHIGAVNLFSTPTSFPISVVT